MMYPYIFCLIVIIIYLFISIVFYRFVLKSTGRERRLIFAIYALVTWKYADLPFDIVYMLDKRGIYIELGHANLLLIFAVSLCLLIFILFISLALLKAKKPGNN